MNASLLDLAMSANVTTADRDQTANVSAFFADNYYNLLCYPHAIFV